MATVNQHSWNALTSPSTNQQTKIEWCCYCGTLKATPPGTLPMPKCVDRTV